MDLFLERVDRENMVKKSRNRENSTLMKDDS